MFFAEKSGDIAIEITGDGFLYNMVRIIAGTLVEVGQGKKGPGRFPPSLRARRDKGRDTRLRQKDYI